MDTNGSNITQSFNNVLHRIIGWIPNIIEFVIIIILGYFVALAVGWLVREVLQLAKLDKYLTRGTVGDWIEKSIGSPSKFFGKVVFWLTWFGALGVAATLANLPLIGRLVSAIYSYIPNVLSAVFILVLAVATSGIVASVVRRTMGDTPTGKIVATVVPVLVMSTAGFAILNALKISPQIVQIAYASMMGSLALGLALAFGLGGREVAARMLNDTYEAGRKQSEQVKKDFQTGTKRGQAEFKKFQKQTPPKKR